MIEVPTEQYPDKEPHFSRGYITDLVFASYDHSQGLPEGQRNIFRFIHSLHPDWTITDEMRSDIQTALLDKIPTVIQHTKTSEGIKVQHRQVSQLMMTSDVQQRLRELQNIFNGHEDTALSEPSQTIPAITKAIITRDYRGLSRKNGRPRHGMDQKTPRGNPWLSYSIYYAVQGHSTGFYELDKMYEKVKVHLDSGLLHREIDAEYACVIDIHNAHPEVNTPYTW